MDVGTVRIGVSLSDPGGVLATPLETLYASDALTDAADLADIAREHGVVEVVVGLPVSLGNRHTASTEAAVAVARALEAELAGGDATGGETPRPSGAMESGAAPSSSAAPVRQGGIPVRLVDERLSTVAATSAMRASGVSAKKGRAAIDQAAAVHILQGWLDARRSALAGPAPAP